MKLMTYHGTVVRCTGDMTELYHCSLRAVDSGFADIEVSDADRPTAAIHFPSSITIEPGVVAGTVRLKLGEVYITAEPSIRLMATNRLTPGIWETFLLLQDADLQLLRLILAEHWLPGQEAAGSSRSASPQLLENFKLKLGDTILDLVVDRPSIQSIKFASGDASAQPRLFVVDPENRGPTELVLLPASNDKQTLPLVDRNEFLVHPNRALLVNGSPDLFREPIFDSPETADFFYKRFWHGGKPALGEHQAACQIKRSENKFVLLQRYCEGIIFDEGGTYSEAGYFHTLHTYPAGLRRDGDRILLERGTMSDAPHLNGPFAIVFNPHLTNYYHWVVEGMLALDVMRQDLPEGTRLLLPGTLATFRATGGSGFDHRRIIDLLGFDHIPVIELDAPLCHVDEAVWLEKYSIQHVPGSSLRAFRDRIQSRLGRPQPRTRRIYIQRRGLRSLANEAEVEAFCQARGFATYRLEEVDDQEQIRLFQEAEFIIAAQGAALSNLLFCGQGTKIIELSPDLEFRPFFWQIASKLGLQFGVLPCPTSDGTFHGTMMVDMSRLLNLYDVVCGISDTNGAA